MFIWESVKDTHIKQMCMHKKIKRRRQNIRIHRENILEKELASQYSCLENSMDTGARWATVHSVTRSGHNLATKSPPPEKIYNK